MEINQLIDQLLNSKIIENQELAVTLLKSTDVTPEEKRRHIDEFIKEYTEGKIDFFSEEHKNIFKAWVELYSAILKDEQKNKK